MEVVSGVAAAHTVLVSREFCHVARIVPFSDGFGLKKWVMICLRESVNKVACGVKRTNLKPEPEGTQT